MMSEADPSKEEFWRWQEYHRIVPDLKNGAVKT